MEDNKAMTVVNKHTGEEITLPAFLQPVQENAIVYGGTIDMRAMLKDHTGHFSIKGITNEGRKSEFTLVNYRTIKGIRPSLTYDKPADFTQYLCFGKVGSVRTFFCLTIGGVSAQGAEEYPALLQISGGAISHIVEARIEDATNDKKQKFGVVKFSHRKATADELEALKTAISQWPEAMTAFCNIPNIDAA